MRVKELGVHLPVLSGPLSCFPSFLPVHAPYLCQAWCSGGRHANCPFCTNMRCSTSQGGGPRGEGGQVALGIRCL